MPVGGFVVSVLPEDTERIIERLKREPTITVYGSDEKGNVIIVIESETSDDMEEIVEKIKKIEGVLTIGLAYLHFEDEVEKIEKGELKPEIGFRKRGVQ